MATPSKSTEVSNIIDGEFEVIPTGPGLLRRGFSALGRGIRAAAGAVAGFVAAEVRATVGPIGAPRLLTDGREARVRGQEPLAKLRQLQSQALTAAREAGVPEERLKQIVAQGGYYPKPPAARKPKAPRPEGMHPLGNGRDWIIPRHLYRQLPVADESQIEGKTYRDFMEVGAICKVLHSRVKDPWDNEDYFLILHRPSGRWTRVHFTPEDLNEEEVVIMLALPITKVVIGRRILGQDEAPTQP